MFERFTDRARKVMALANQEAQRFNHEYVGTEHILLGLVKEGQGVAANVLHNLQVDLKKIRLEVEKIVKSGPNMVTMGKLPQTPRAKKVIEFAIEEARNLGHNYVGTEHLLLGLLREHDGVAAQVLMNLGLKLDDVRAEVLNILGATMEGEGRPGRAPRKSSGGTVSPRRRPSIPSGGTSRNWPPRANSTRSSAASTRSNASSRSSAAAPRTTPSSWARRASARPPSSRAWPSRSPAARSPNSS